MDCQPRLRVAPTLLVIISSVDLSWQCYVNIITDIYLFIDWFISKSARDTLGPHWGIPLCGIGQQ